jgi:acetamidase/formamidase
LTIQLNLRPDTATGQPHPAAKPDGANSPVRGVYALNEKPKLKIKSGDTVSIETLSHSLGQIKRGVDMDEMVKLRKANPGGGPHSITGPIYVEGAEPGDTLEIRILKIVPKADAFNFNVPGKDFPTVGRLAPEFPEGFVR